MSDLYKNSKTELIYEFDDGKTLTVTRFVKDRPDEDVEVWYNINGSDLDWDAMSNLVNSLVALEEVE